MTNGNKPPTPELLWYILSYFFPILGIILAIMYMQKPEAEVKTFGKNCLIVAILSLTLSTIFCCIAVAILVLLN